MYTIHLVVTDEVTEAERDEFLRLFSHRKSEQSDATRWLRQWMRDTKMKQPEIEELPGFDELFAKTIAKTLKAMPLERRLEGVTTEELVVALPLDVLRHLTEEYLRSLSPQAQEQIRQRLTGKAD